MAKILVAEDDGVARLLMREIIEGMGHVAFLSPNGEHAYESLELNQGFELLITDLMMPKMDGTQLIKTLRGHSSFMDLPIIIISAVLGVKEISYLLDLGATYFLPKPLNIQEMKEHIAKCLALRK